VGGGLPPGAKRITAEQSGHRVQLDQPSIVVDAIREMLVNFEKQRPHAVRESAAHDGEDGT